MNLAEAIEVPVLPNSDAEIMGCIVNAENQVAKYGGRVVTGWAFGSDIMGIRQLIHHAIWESPEGELFDVTPGASIDGGQVIVGWEKTTKSIRDPDAHFIEDEGGQRSLPTQYVTTQKNRHVELACEYLRRSDKALWSFCHGNDSTKQTADYWKSKAEKELSKVFGGRVVIGG